MAAGLLVELVPGFDSWFQLAWKGTAVLLAAWGSARLLRHSPASARHLVWAAALVALLALPVLAIVGPVWRLEILSVAAPGLKSQPTSASRPASAPAPVSVGRNASAAGRVVPDTSDYQYGVSGFGRTDEGPPEGGHYIRSPYVSFVLATMWAAGALFGLLRLATGLVWAGWIRRRACREACLVPMNDWTRDVAEASALLGLMRRVPVFISDRVGVPVTCGIVRPALLLPSDADAWPDSRRRAVLLHELAHVVRHDCLVQAIAHAARSLHWFNPLAFLALRRLRHEQELACDDIVLGVGVSAVEYARHLCDVAGAMRSMSSPEWATLAMAQPSNLEARVTSMLDDRIRRHAPRRVYRAAVALIVAGVLPFSALRLSAVTTPVLPGMARFVSRHVLVPEVPDMAVTSALATDVNALRADSANAAELAPARDAVPDVAVDELGRSPDFSGTWILDEERSGSLGVQQSWNEHSRGQWGNVVVIRQGDSSLRIESHRGDQKATARYELDDRDYRYVEERSSVGGGISLRGSDVKTVWDSGKLVTLTRPFSLWVPDEHDIADAPNRSSMEFLSIRSLSTDGQEMIVERVSRHDWGWGFDGRQPSAAYARITDVYRRVVP